MLNTKHVLMLKEFITKSQYDLQSYHSLDEELNIDNGKEVFKNVYKIYHAYKKLENCLFHRIFRNMSSMANFDFSNITLVKVADLYRDVKNYHTDDILDIIITKKYFPDEEPRDILLDLKTIKDRLPEIEKLVDHNSWEDWHVILDDDFKESLDELIDGIVAFEKELPE